MTHRARLVALLGVLAVACSRKAPGPEECRRFALAVSGLQAEEELDSRRSRALALRDAVDELTRECLVVPYDRELLRCARATGRLIACRAQFKQRRSLESGRRLQR